MPDTIQEPEAESETVDSNQMNLYKIGGGGPKAKKAGKEARYENTARLR